MFKSIVVGTDGSETAQEAVKLAAKLALENRARLHVVSCARTPSPALAGAEIVGAGMPAGPEWEESARREIDGVLEQAEAAVHPGLEVARHARMGDPGEALVDVAVEVAADLIVVGNRGMQGARRFLGSVPNHVSHHAPCSVLILRTT